LNFTMNSICAKTRVFELFVGERVTTPVELDDRRTDGQTDGHPYYSNTSTCIAYCATALVKTVNIGISNATGDSACANESFVAYIFYCVFRPKSP